MEWINGFKYILISTIFGIIITICSISVGNLERISIVMASLILSVFIYNIKKQTIKSLCLIILGIFIGFQLAATALYLVEIGNNQGYDVFSDDTNENSSEKVAVLLVFKGEAERYSISSVLGDLKEEVSLFKTYSIPIRLYRLKSAYEWAGISRYNEYAVNIGELLSKHLGNGYDVYMAYSRGEPSLTSVINNSITNKQYSRLITVPVFLSEDNEYTSITKDVKRLDFYHGNIQIKYLNTMFDSEKLAKGIVEEINYKNSVEEKSDLGFIITDLSVDKIDDDFDTTSKNQEKLFMEMIKAKLIEGGFEERKIKFANYKNEREGIEGRLIELQQYGISNFFIIGINDIYNSVDEAYRVGRTINKIMEKDDISVSYIEGWGLNNWLIDELEYKIRVLSTQEWKP